MKTQTQPPAAKPETAQPAPGQPRRLESVALFGSGDEVLIVHAGETYRLRRTRQGKLILTK
jgi:hemin uptake protein HemP